MVGVYIEFKLSHSPRAGHSISRRHEHFKRTTSTLHGVFVLNPPAASYYRVFILRPLVSIFVSFDDTCRDRRAIFGAERARSVRSKVKTRRESDREVPVTKDSGDKLPPLEICEIRTCFRIAFVCRKNAYTKISRRIYFACYKYEPYKRHARSYLLGLILIDRYLHGENIVVKVATKFLYSRDIRITAEIIAYLSRKCCTCTHV